MDTIKHVRRSAKPVNLTTAVDPKFLTLTGAPANQTAFKVVRKDGEKTGMQHIQRRRAQRSDSLVSVMFEVGATEEQVTECMDEWGFTTFTIETSGDRLKAVLRSDVDQPTMSVTIDGRSCEVLKPISNATSDTKTQIAVARMDFAADAFPTVEEVKDWCKRNDIDTSEMSFTSTDLVTSVQRHDTKDTETRAISVESGVDFAVIRADVADIPAKFVTVISDTSYGSWGWGQLDFSAYLADKEFTEASRDAMYALQNVLDQIQFYSAVPIPVRKDLVKNACAQYAEYVVALMDALPSKVVVAIRSDLTKESPVTTAAKGAPAPAQRTDDKKPDAAAPAAAAPAADAGAPVTRGDVEQMIQTAVTATTATVATTVAEAVAAAFAAQRADKKEDGEGEKKPEADKKDAKEGEDAAKRSDADKADKEPTLAEVLRSVQALGEQVKAIRSDVDGIDGGTVVRSDAADSKGKEPGAPGEQKDVFRGVFGRGLSKG